MRKLILASHGSLAEGMASAVRMILGDAAELSCFSLDHYVSPQEIGEAVRGLVEAEPETRFLLSSDIKGGSVHNQLFPLCKRPNVQLVSGMNLSLTLELALLGEDGPAEESIREAMQIGCGNMDYFDKNILGRELNGLGEDKEESLW